MLLPKPIQNKTTSFGVDLIVLLFVLALIYSLVLFTKEVDSSYNPSYELDLSLSALPLYSLFSAIRGLVAYLFSLVFTLCIGYLAAKSKPAEKIIIPLLDILQSIPVLGFLPGLVLGLVALFPKSNLGLELAAILMIFTGQVWNMTFAFYSSVKSVPIDLQEASTIMNMSKFSKLIKIELPFSAVNLVWNSIMSMAGGWFFLTVCEAFTLGDKEYRLPGIGSYMALAIKNNNTEAIIAAILAMALIVILLDILLWRPALSFVHKFRLENSVTTDSDDLIVNFIFANSYLLKILRQIKIDSNRKALFKVKVKKYRLPLKLPQILWPKIFSFLKIPAIILTISFLILLAVRLIDLLSNVQLSTWLTILTGTFYTFLRVVAAVSIATLWALPAGIWISRSQARMKIVQPISQLLASFPAPMLYPLVLALTFKLGIDFHISSMILILLGVQWYILFNTLAGGLRISAEIENSMKLMNVSTKNIWRHLYIPSVFPSLVTGWITAAGGAWNASIVAEYISYQGKTIETLGLGSLISQSAASANFTMLAACLTVMIATVILLNRVFWNPVYKLSQVRFRLDF